MYVDLILNYDSKEALIAAVEAEVSIDAINSTTLEPLPDGVDTLMRIMGYPNYHFWTARVTVKGGKVIAVK